MSRKVKPKFWKWRRELVILYAKLIKILQMRDICKKVQKSFIPAISKIYFCEWTKSIWNVSISDFLWFNGITIGNVLLKFEYIVTLHRILSIHTFTYFHYGSCNSTIVIQTYYNFSGRWAICYDPKWTKNEQHQLYTLLFVSFSQIINSIPFFKHSTASSPSKSSPSVMYLLKPLLGSISMAFLRHWYFF